MVECTDLFEETLNREVTEYLELTPIYDETTEGEDYEYIASAKLKFKCPVCENKWTTAHGTVKFVYYLYFKKRILFVQVYIYQQRCLPCNRMASFKTYDDEAVRLSYDFVDFIDRKYFGGENDEERPQRNSRAINNHKVLYCDACERGICVYLRRLRREQRRQTEEQKRETQDIS
ncbi:UNKNOWN [Stylonychia lemnae]|uniref:3CxxC-type domain-containing protein n=1 Tax=Stylonychia lemnae TaxID=5949 RepID=A0A077ZXN1_STYLE|nr:UNKNOWN [Stylonychia lemnae]|eukprot:CDW74306.1 UNKNOWN [Stylonychia lemnae]